MEVADDAAPPLDERLLEDEQLGAVLAAFEQMAPKCQDLLRLLCTDPPLDYEAISEILDMPIGSIGPTRSRCLERLRRHLETQ